MAEAPTSPSSSTRLGWIGLGNMGLAMATNLQKYLTTIHAPPLAYTNRTLSRGDTLAALGASPYPSPAEVVAASDIVLISLSDDAALLSTVQTLLSIQPSLPSKTLIDTSTVHPDTTTQVTTLLTSASASFISAPVFGATPVAQAGRLLFALAGPPEAVSLVSPYISSCLARRIIHVSSNPRDATLLKTTGNFLTAALQESIAEAHVFAELAGLNGDVVHELVEGNYGEYAGGVSEKMLQGVYAPPKGQRSRSDARLAVKDVGHGLSVAGSVGARLEVGEVTMRRLRGAVEWGNREGREVDSSAVYGVVRVEAGLGFEREKKVGGSEAVEEPVESDDR